MVFILVYPVVSLTVVGTGITTLFYTDAKQDLLTRSLISSCSSSYSEKRLLFLEEAKPGQYVEWFGRWLIAVDTAARFQG